jgi:hypothetical protein
VTSSALQKQPALRPAGARLLADALAGARAMLANDPPKGPNQARSA